MIFNDFFDDFNKKYLLISIIEMISDDLLLIFVIFLIIFLIFNEFQ